MKFREVREVKKPVTRIKSKSSAEVDAIYTSLFADDFVMPVEEPVKEEHIDVQTEIAAMFADDFDPCKKIDTKIILAK